MQWRDAKRCEEVFAVWLSQGSHEEVGPGRIFPHCRGIFNSLTACGERLQKAIHQVPPGKTSSPQLSGILTDESVTFVMSSGSVHLRCSVWSA